MTVALGIFGRAPVPGRTKTRLIPALGAEAAASLYAAMLADVLEHARAAADVEVTFWSADDARCPELETLLGDVPRRVQCEGDLGARMHHALQHGIASHGRAILIGSDAPTLSASHLLAATTALDQADVVLGGAEDGGYSLIAARRVVPGLFAGVRFSTEHTLTDTERACRARSLSVAHSPPCRDVDDAADLARLAGELEAHPERAPRTAAWLRTHEHETQTWS